MKIRVSFDEDYRDEFLSLLRKNDIRMNSSRTIRNSDFSNNKVTIIDDKHDDFIRKGGKFAAQGTSYNTDYYYPKDKRKIKSKLNICNIQRQIEQNYKI